MKQLTGGDAGVRVDDGWGNAFADYDNDGDLDLAVGGGEGLRLFRNDGNGNHWLQVRVTGKESNRSGIGARIVIAPAEAEKVAGSSKQVAVKSAKFKGAKGAAHSTPCL